jgi:hypothetical protein
MKHVLSIAVCMLLLGACRSLKISDFHQNAPTAEPLPRLKLEVHTESFALLFGKELVERMLVQGALGPGPYLPNPIGVITQVGQPIHDVFVVLGNELNDNLVQNSGEESGKARFKLIYYNRGNSGWGYTIPSILTLGAVNVLALPAGVTRSEVELQMEITDNSGKVLSRYRAPGIGKAKVAMYHGYSGFGAMRKANLLALQDAMQGIKQQLAADLPNLQTQLALDAPTK